MEHYEPSLSFGEEVAARYDDVPRGDEAACVAFLEPLAGGPGGGPALELAIGTGRIALPLAAAGVCLHAIVTRYAWPSELDLMARLAGLRRRERWAGWEREPFTGASRAHVSVYGR